LWRLNEELPEKCFETPLLAGNFHAASASEYDLSLSSQTVAEHSSDMAIYATEGYGVEGDQGNTFESSTTKSASDVSEEPADQGWSAVEEQRLVRKLDMLVMSLLTLASFALQLDRGNMSAPKQDHEGAGIGELTARSGNTLTDYFLKDVGITQSQYNVGQQMLSLGIVLLEVSRIPPQAFQDRC
jgi:hypothetical protein